MNKIFFLLIIVPILFLIFFSGELFEEKNEIKYTEIPIPESLFKIIAPSSTLSIDQVTQIITYEQAVFQLKPEFSEIYSKIGYKNNEKSNVAVIYPTFTESAYSTNGFYDYYTSDCDESCLSVSIQENFEGEYESSRAAHRVLKLLGYETITDIEVDKDPTILEKFEKIILLHNEYVTKKEFDAITAHPNVVYLYPNALYAEISANYETNVIKLIRGHGYPSSSIDNGFNWKYENTRPYEFDNICQNWEFYEISNGYMLNCYPEHIIFQDQKLLQTIKELSK